jgi:hypothetical protein
MAIQGLMLEQPRLIDDTPLAMIAQSILSLLRPSVYRPRGSIQ